MKLATATTSPDFVALGKLSFSHSVDYELIELKAKKRAYARLYERYKLLMEMEENGITVTVTMTSDAGTMVVENDQQFEPMEYLNAISLALNTRAAEILDLSDQLQKGTLFRSSEEGHEQMALNLQAHALCMPAAPAQPGIVTAAPATPAALAA